MINLTQVPFSTFGSWLSVSPSLGLKETPTAVQTLYLRSHHGARPGVVKAFLQLCPLTLDAALTTESTALEMTAHVRPEAVIWRDGQGGCIDICFDTPYTLRFRGQGLGLELKACYETVMFALQNNQIVLNIFDVSRRFVLEGVQGTLQNQGAWRADSKEANRKEPVSVTVLPGDTGAWEFALHEVQSTFTVKPLREFDTCRAAAKTSFDTWISQTLPAPSQWQEARELAAYINWASIVEPEGLLKRPAMLMSKHWMSSVWSWDHCFNALALAETDNKLAWDQLLLLVDYQDAHGCYPDSLNDVEVIYNFTKPPIHGWAVRELLKVATPSLATLQTMYASLSRWTTWWLENRRLPGQPLPYYLHGNDSGWDNGTMFDKGVPLVAPDLAAFLILQLDTLADLAKALGTNEEMTWKHKADTLLEALLAQLWTGERFVAKLALTQETVAGDSLLYCLPILLGERLPEKVRDKLAQQVKSFLTDYGLATEKTDSAYYKKDGYWRGPIWAPPTYLVVQGLEGCGHRELALDIAERFCALCASSGFAENFDALTGEGLCDKAYTWTSSVFLLLAEKLATAK
jgi:putative isomerase